MDYFANGKNFAQRLTSAEDSSAIAFQLLSQLRHRSSEHAQPSYSNNVPHQATGHGLTPYANVVEGSFGGIEHAMQGSSCGRFILFAAVYQIEQRP
jgi:hypothetical protein